MKLFTEILNGEDGTHLTPSDAQCHSKSQADVINLDSRVASNSYKVFVLFKIVHASVHTHTHMHAHIYTILG